MHHLHRHQQGNIQMSDQWNPFRQELDLQEVVMMTQGTVMMETGMMVITIAEEERSVMMMTPEEMGIMTDPEKEDKAAVPVVEMDQVGEAGGGVDPERDDRQVQE